MQKVASVLSKNKGTSKASPNVPATGIRRFSLVSPMVPIRENNYSNDSNSDDECYLEENMKRLDIIRENSKFQIEISGFNSTQVVCGKTKMSSYSPGVVSNFSAGMATTQKRSKNSPYLYETSSSEAESDMDDDWSLDENELPNPLSNFHDATKSARANAQIRRNSAYLACAPRKPTKTYKYCSGTFNAYSESSDDEMDDENHDENEDVSNQLVTKVANKTRRMTINSESLRI